MNTPCIVFSGSTASSILRGIYQPGSRDDLSPWAYGLGLGVLSDGGLVNAAAPPMAASLAGVLTSPKDIREALARVPVPQRLVGRRPELLFGERDARPRCRDVTARLWSTPLPNDALIPLGGGLAVASPQLAFVLRAHDLGLAELISYGNELCGAYSLDSSDRGFNDHAPFASAESLCRFLAGCSGAGGCKVARVAAKWVRDGFRSPRESDTCLLTMLPRVYGGYGMHPRPEVNGVVNVPASLRYLADVPSYEVDLLWRGSKAAIEYDGGDHDDPEQRIRDDTKTHVLESMGYLVLRINRDILGDERQFDRRVRLLADRLGVEVPPATSDFMMRRRALRKALLR